MSTALDIFNDVLIMGIQMFLVRKVQLSLRTKIAVGSVFFMGAIIIAFAIIRIIVTDRANMHPEISWLNVWSAIETTVAVSICCLMVFKQLLTRRKVGYTRQQPSSRYDVNTRQRIRNGIYRWFNILYGGHHLKA